MRKNKKIHILFWYFIFSFLSLAFSGCTCNDEFIYKSAIAPNLSYQKHKHSKAHASVFTDDKEEMDIIQPDIEIVGNKPELWISENYHDFDKTKAGSTMEHRFLLANKGSAPLTILNISKSCGCTTTEIPHNILQPGESTELNVTLHVGHTDGKLNRYITILTDGPNHPQTKITLTADVYGSKNLHFSRSNKSGKTSNQTKSPPDTDTSPVSQNSAGIIRRSRQAQK